MHSYWDSTVQTTNAREPQSSALGACSSCGSLIPCRVVKPCGALAEGLILRVGRVGLGHRPSMQCKCKGRIQWLEREVADVTVGRRESFKHDYSGPVEAGPCRTPRQLLNCFSRNSSDLRLGTILGQFWDHLGSIFGAFWDHFGPFLGPFLGPFWDHFGTILGPFWEYLGAFWHHFGSIWEHFGTILEAFWHHFGSIWEHFGTILEAFWDHFGTFWDYFGTILGVFRSILAPFWEHLGSILGQLWNNFGPILAILGPFWEHFGNILGQFWDNFGLQAVVSLVWIPRNHFFSRGFC